MNSPPVVKRVPRKKKRVNRRRKAANLEVMVKGIERPFPPSRTIKVITTTDGSIQDTANPFVIVESRLADPTAAGFSGGSGAFVIARTGILDMAAYALARVRRVTVEFSGSSLEPNAIINVNMIFSDTQPSTIITSFALAKSGAINFLHTPLRKIAVVSGNSAFRMTPVSITARQVIGDIMPITDRDFVTAVNPIHSAPVQEWWVGVIVTAVNGALNVINGLDVNLTITQEVEAFSRLIGA